MELLPGFGPGTSSLPRGEGEGLDDGISSFRPLRVLKKVLNCFVEDLRKLYAKILRTAEAVIRLLLLRTAEGHRQMAEARRIRDELI